MLVPAGRHQHHLVVKIRSVVRRAAAATDDRSLGVQDDHMDARNDFSFHVPIRKCLLTHQDSTCPPSLELDPWRTGRVPDRSLHFNVSNNPTLLNYLKQ